MTDKSFDTFLETLVPERHKDAPATPVERTRLDEIFSTPGEDRPASRADATKAPWLERPDLEWADMAWRMGGSDGYLDTFCDWFTALRAHRQIAFVLDNPEPSGWQGFYRPLCQPVTDALEQSVIREVIRLHDFISGWFRADVPPDEFDQALMNVLHDNIRNVQPSGTSLTKAALDASLRPAYGANDRFRIVIEQPRVVAAWHGALIATYVELQTGARNSAPENRRRSVAVFDCDPSLVWRYLHESAMPE